MHAGGFKGRSRVVSGAELRDQIEQRLGVPTDHCVNLLGMTELASQLYDDTLRASVAGRAPTPGKVNPPWTRTVVVDPITLEPVPDGEPGLLVHLDLANIERPAAIRTLDVGRVLVDEAGRGFEVLGRTHDAEARGCSLSIDDLVR
jgi:hypothetical protein